MLKNLNNNCKSNSKKMKLSTQIYSSHLNLINHKNNKICNRRKKITRFKRKKNKMAKILLLKYKMYNRNKRSRKVLVSLKEVKNQIKKKMKKKKMERRMKKRRRVAKNQLKSKMKKIKISNKILVII